MSKNLEIVVKTLNNPKGSLNLIRELLPKDPPSLLAQLLWEGFRADKLDLGRQTNYLYELAKAPEAYSAADVVKLINSLNRNYPGGAKKELNNTHHCWEEFNIPGLPYGLFKLLEAKKEDNNFFAELKKSYKNLPDPYPLGFSYALLVLKIIDITEVPEDLLPAAAKIYVQGPNFLCGDHPKNFWPEKIWGQALVKADMKSDTTFEEPQVITELIPHDKPQRIIDSINKIKDFTNFWDRVEAMDDFGKENIKLLESAVKKLKITSINNDVMIVTPPWPAIYLIPMYLRACKHNDQIPSKTLDKVFADFYTHYEPNWSGTYFKKVHKNLYKTLAIIPQPRLEKILLKIPKPPLLLVHSAATPKILEKTINYLAQNNIDHLTNEYACTGYEHLKFFLENLGPEVVPILIETLKKPCLNPLLIVQTLTNFKHPSSAEVLIATLAHKSKPVRDTAEEGLTKLSHKVFLPFLPHALNSQKKDVRLAAANLLAGTPPGIPQRRELAKERLKKEKVKTVIKILETLATDVTTEAPEKIELIEGLNEKTWKKYVHLGPKLIDHYYLYIKTNHNGGQLNPYNDDYKGWLKVLGHAKNNDPDAEKKAVRAVVALNYHNGPKYLNSLTKIFPTVPKTLAELYVGKQIKRDPDFEEYSISFKAEHVLHYLSPGPDTITALLEGLQSKSKKDFNIVKPKLIQMGKAALKTLHPLLTSNKIEIRRRTFDILKETKDSASLTTLKNALKKEKSSSHRVNLQTLIDLLHSMNLDLTSFSDDKKGTQNLDQALAKLNLSKPDQLKTPLPQLHWVTTSGEIKMSEEAMNWFLRQLLQEDKETHSEQLKEIRRRLNDDDCYNLCEKMIQTSPRKDRGWPLYIQSVIGSPKRIEETAKQLETLASSAQTSWGSEVVKALVRHDSNLAIRWLDHWQRKSRRKVLRHKAATGLIEMAENRTMEVEDLLDLAMPDFGFDFKGTQILDYGPRTITANLTPDKKIIYIDDKGVSRKTLPAKRKSDDAKKVAAVKEQFRNFKQQINQTTGALVERLKIAMIDGREWNFKTWTARFLKHPIFFSVANKLVFETIDGTRSQQFAISEEGEIISAEGDEIKLTNVPIRLVHPATLTAEELSEWKEHMEDREIQQPFQQLQRTCFMAKDFSSNLKEVLLALPSVSASLFLRRLRKLRYEPGNRGDAESISDASKVMGGLTIVIAHNSYYFGMLDKFEDIEINNVIIKDPEKWGDNSLIDFYNLPPRLFSELIRDFYLLTEK